MKAIITFHSIDSSGSLLSYPPAAFGDLVRSIAASQLPVRDLPTLLQSETARGVAITFDDGMASVFHEALPILKDFGLQAHLFLTTGAVARDNRWPTQPASAPVFPMLDWNQIEVCHAAGICIECHTVSHSDLRALGDRELEDECAAADETIVRRLGRRPQYFAYPYGFSDERTRRFVRGRYRAGVTNRLRPLRPDDDSAALPRIDSYYLRSALLYRRIETPLARAYLAVRSLLRTLRGTQ